MNTLLLNGLRDEAAIVRTASFELIAERLRFTTSLHATMVVSGPHGTGKRLALLTCLAEQALPYVVAPLPPTPSDKDLTRLLYEAIHSNRDNFDLHSMQDELVDTLSEQPRIIVIDRTENLTTRAAGQLHYLHARSNATWSLVLLGGPDTGRIITTSAALRGDVLATVEVPLLTGDQLVRAVRGMHPLFTMADEPLLVLIDKQLCGGQLKRWGQFLQIALDVRNRAVLAGHDAPVLDVTLTRAVIGLMPQLRTNRKR